MNLYAEISKSEKQDDGTLKVWGYASTAAVDSSGETVTTEAMKAALPDYMKFGAVREMHSKTAAAGTAIEASVDDEGRTYFGAHVVDPIAVKKCETGVYKGFSIGGKVTARDTLKKSTITGINLVEISLVDRPCNPEAVFTMFKADSLMAEEAVEELAKLLNTGTISAQRLVELAKAAQDAPAEAETTETIGKAAETPPAPASQATDPAAPAEEPLKKGMYSLQDFGQALSSLSCLAIGAADEASWEADGSKVPAQLAEWVKAGVAIFQAMAVEESNELVASLKALAPPAVEVITLAAHTDDLAKAATAHGDELAKVTGELDLAKAAVSTLTTERDELKKRNETLAAMPAPGKALLRALAKGEDLGDPAAELKKVAPVIGATGTEDEVATLIKAAHAARIPLN